MRYSPKCQFIATNRDVAYPDAHQLCPGGGSLVAALEVGSGRTADVVAGKPSPHLISIVSQATGLVPSRTCMVGDRLDTDIAFGSAGGFQTLLVLTGVTSVLDAEHVEEGDARRPHFVLESFGALAKLWRG